MTVFFFSFASVRSRAFYEGFFNIFFLTTSSVYSNYQLNSLENRQSDTHGYTPDNDPATHKNPTQTMTLLHINTPP